MASLQKNWVLATNTNLLKPTFLQPDGVNLWYFTLRLFDLTELIVWNIQGYNKNRKPQKSIITLPIIYLKPGLVAT